MWCVGVILIGVGDDVFEFAGWEEFGHGTCDHRFSGTGVTDEHDMAFLFGCFFDDVYGFVLSNNLINKTIRYFDFFGGFEFSFFYPLVDWGEFFVLRYFFCGFFFWHYDSPLFEKYEC